MSAQIEGKLILDILIYTFEDELLRRYGSIGIFMQQYPEVNEAVILGSLNAHLSDPARHLNSILSNTRKLNKEQRKLLIEQSSSFINSRIRQMELPGEKGHVKHRLSQLVNNMKK